MPASKPTQPESIAAITINHPAIRTNPVAIKVPVKGFTMVELVAVIVILGIITAAVIPHFLSVRRDAVIASLQGVEAAIGSGHKQVYMLAQVAGPGATQVEFEGNLVTLDSGFAEAAWSRSIRRMMIIDASPDFTPGNQRCEDEFCGIGNQPPAQAPGAGLTEGLVVIVWPRNYLIADECYAYYNNPLNGQLPNIGVHTTGC